MTQLAPAQIDAPGLDEGVWIVDPAHSNAHFEVGHPHVAKVRGSIPVTEGRLSVGPNLASTAINLVLDPARVRTGLGDRDDKLLGPNFFDVDSYPVWSFRSSEITRAGHQFLVKGELTMHGRTRPAEFVAQFDGLDALPDGVPQAAFTADGRIARADWGLTWTEAQAGSSVRTAEDVAVGVHVVVTPAD